MKTSWIAGVAVAAILAGCSNPPSDTKTADSGDKQPAGKKYVIGATIDRLDNDYFVKIKDGIEARAKELGYTANVQDAQGKDDQQIKQIETFTNQGVDAIIIAAVNDNVPGVEQAIEKARDKGIKVVSQSQLVDTADAYVSIEQGPYGEMGGKMAGEWITANLGGKADVAILSLPERPTIIQRAEGIQKALLAACPGAKVVATPQAPQNSEKTRSNMEAALEAHPTIQVVISYNDDSALAAAAAIKAKMGAQAAKANKKYAVFGLDAIPQALAALKDPTSPYMGSVDIDPFTNGKQDVDVAMALLQGKDIGAKKKTKAGVPWIEVAMKPVKAGN